MAQIILKKSKSLLKDISGEEANALVSQEHQVFASEADETSLIADRSVDLVVTSPPFLDVVDYRIDNWLRCWFNGIEASSLPISQLRKPEDWVAKMSSVFPSLNAF